MTKTLVKSQRFLHKKHATAIKQLRVSLIYFYCYSIQDLTVFSQKHSNAPSKVISSASSS